MRTARIVFALALLAGMIYLVGAADLLAVLARIDPWYLAALIGMSFVLITLSCIKWQLFIRAFGHDEHILQLMRIYTVIYFYNIFAPSFLVGDAARSFHLGKRIENQKDAFISTFLERVTGILAMVLLATAFVGFGATATAGVEASILFVSFFVVLGAFICFSERAFNLFTAAGMVFVRALKKPKLTAKCEKLIAGISQAVAVARRNPSLFFKAMFWSICFHFGTVINTYVAARTVGWENPDFAGLCVVVPLVLLVSIAPLTPSGIGIQEGAFLFFLQRIGATRPEALGVGLILRAKGLVTAFVGWLLWLSLKNEKAKGKETSKQTEPALSS